ncbi:MAG: TldD/PmbA family protein [Rhodobacteraceae bacterium]|nr:TldD/PmbA family protein [Paracoccaceae bacterium]
MSSDLPSLAEQALAAAKRIGADAADVLVSESASISIEALNGALEQADRSESVEIGLRVFVGARQASISSANTSAEAVAALAERAVAMAKVAPEDPFGVLADPEQLSDVTDARELELVDPSPEPSPETLLNAALAGEAAALAVDGVSAVQGASAAYGWRNIHLGTSTGFSGGLSRTDFMQSVVAITGEGTSMERDYFGEGRNWAEDMPDPSEIGRIAGERTAERAGSRKPPTGAFPVCFDERVSTTLIGHLLQATNGASVARGVSWLRDAVGEQVLPSSLSVVEEPHRKRTSGSRVFDAEGLKTYCRSIVSDGVLSGFTLDLASARKLGLDSTASAYRGASGPPSSGVSNVSLTGGSGGRQDLLDQMGTGLLVTSLIGSTVNPNTGDYSRGASGFWVENGEIKYPVNECTIAGNLKPMLLGLVAADDARAHLSRRVPSLLLEGMMIAGS